MPTYRHGKNTVVLVDANDLSSFFNEASSTREVETAETTSFGSSAKTYISGLKDGTISVSGMFDGSASAVDQILTAAIGSATDSITTIAVEGTATGGLCHMAAVQETSYEVTSPVGDVVSTSAEFQADGGVESGRVLTSTAISTATTTNGTAVDNAAATTNGGVAHLHVTANTRNGTTTVKVQHSADNSTWVDLVTFTTVTASTTTSQRVELAAGTTVNRYLRSQVTTAGASGSVTASIAFARR